MGVTCLVGLIVVACSGKKGASDAPLPGASDGGADGAAGATGHFIVGGAGPACSELPAEVAAGAIVIDGSGSGRFFDAIGALSAGASSRLLYDYPPQRNEILDFLFKPGFGASLHLLKVEIGSDTDSTCGAEAGHQRTPQDENFHRGYEWWLMKEAKARNPDIKLAALQWGAPGWMTSFFSPENIDFIVKWVEGARSAHGLTIDYVGGWNEMGFSAPWFVNLRAALAAKGLSTQIIAADTPGSWDIARAMSLDPALNQAVDVIGSHYACGYLGDGSRCGSLPFLADARANGKPVWASEEGSQPYTSGAIMARTYNRSYIQAGITGSINWSLVASWYTNLPFDGVDGLLAANQPWSGWYAVDKSIWVTAHTAQFVEPGWQYLDGASRLLPGIGSVVALRAPNGQDWTAVVETTNATADITLDFVEAGNIFQGPLRIWSTNLASGSTTEDWLARLPDVQPERCAFSLLAQPNHLYTLTTTSGQSKGASVPPPAAAMTLPYEDDFESYSVGAMPNLPRYFSAVNGAFEVEQCVGGRAGKCLQQEITVAPIKWGNAGAPNPVALVGDPSWTDYAVQVDALLQRPGTVDLSGRVTAQSQYGTGVQGFHLLVSDSGSFNLAFQNANGGNLSLASGAVSFPVGAWHTLGLQFQGDQISALFDGAILATVTSTVYAHGNAGLAVSKWNDAQFDNFRVTAR